MNRFHLFKIIFAIVFVNAISAYLHAEIEIIPNHWRDTYTVLEQAEDTIQKQLDTGIAMGSVAWDKANVKDARLFMIYVLLYQKLNQKDQKALFKEQSEWLKMRKSEVLKLDNPDGGTAVRLDMAAKFMDLTDARIKELQNRLEKSK